MLAQAGFQLGDLAVQFGDDPDGRAGGGGERGCDRCGCGQLFCP